MLAKTKLRRNSTVVSALSVRTHFGRILREVERDRRTFVVEKRGAAKAVILGIPEYLRLAAPEPEILRIIGEESKRTGTSRLTVKQIDSLVREARREKSRKNAAAPAGS
ncbi:MAG: type II toxin-antitoxin system Phd/YefM family antitoxin [Terriglobia bacterium]